MHLLLFPRFVFEFLFSLINIIWQSLILSAACPLSEKVVAIFQPGVNAPFPPFQCGLFVWAGIVLLSAGILLFLRHKVRLYSWSLSNRIST